MRKKAFSADNQQGSEHINCYGLRPSETTRRPPLSKKEIKSYLLGALHDGTFSSNERFRISQKGTEWLKVLQKLFVEKIRSWHPKKIKTLRRRMMI
jgi:hypothetical protein